MKCDECPAAWAERDIMTACSECENYGKGNFGMAYCRKDNHEIWWRDSACEDFKEREE